MQTAGTRGRTAMVLTMVLTFSACDAIRFWEKKETPVDTSTPIEREVMGVRNKATIIQSTITTLDRRNVPTFRLGDSTIDVSLYSEGGMLRLIDERIQAASSSRFRNRYYFDNDGFFHYYGRGDLRVNLGVDPPEYAELVSRMYFNTKGNLFHSEKLINNLETGLESQEVPRVMRRAFALRSLDWGDSVGVNTTGFLDMLYTAENLPAEQEMVSTLREDDPSGTAIIGEDQAEKEAAGVPESEPGSKAPATVQPTQNIGSVERTQKSSTRRQTSEATQQRAAQTQPAVPPTQQRTSPSVPGAPPPAPVPADEILIEKHTHAMLPGQLSSHRIRFQKGNTGATLSAAVKKGRHMEYVLRARRGQRMSVSMQTSDPHAYFRVFLKDGDISGQRRNWSGTLPRYDDYHIVVYLRTEAPRNAEAAYTITMSVE